MRPLVNLWWLSFASCALGVPTHGGTASSGGTSSGSSAGSYGGSSGGTGSSSGTGASSGTGSSSSAGASSGSGSSSGGSSSAGASSGNGSSSGASGPGHVIYLYGGHLHRIAAASGATPEDLTSELPGGASGWCGDSSPDGEWLVYGGDTGCSDYAGSGCLMRAASNDWSGATEVKPGGASVDPFSRATIASGGKVIVYAVAGTHALDLYATTFDGAQWSSPKLLTGGSSESYNQYPRFSPDGSKIVFDCGSDVYVQTNTTICEVNSDGSGFLKRLQPWPAAGSPQERHHAGFAPDGSLIFEADANAERIWRLAEASAIPTVLGDFGDDNTPCVLPDGRVASLYLNRPGNTSGAHELKIMNLDGTGSFMLVTFSGGDGIVDVGIGCGL